MKNPVGYAPSLFVYFGYFVVFPLIAALPHRVCSHGTTDLSQSLESAFRLAMLQFDE